MTKTDIMKDFLKKAVLPVVVALFLYSIFSRIFVDNGTMDLFLICCVTIFGRLSFSNTTGSLGWAGLLILSLPLCWWRVISTLTTFTILGNSL